MATPYVSVVVEDIPSTQDEAAARADEAPVLVVAARQSAGRGRGGRRWETAPRSLAASLAVQPENWEKADFPRLSLVAGLAARAALGSNLDCKWPNDLLLGGDKVAGLLAEAVGEVVVIGLGANLWWPDPPDGFGSLFDEDPGPSLGADLAARWCGDLLDRIAAGPEAWGHDEYRTVCTTIGRSIRWNPNGYGVAVDVDDCGRLVVETPAGRAVLASGEVSEVR